MKILKRKQIIVALDFNSIEEANSIVKLLDPETYRLIEDLYNNKNRMDNK